MTIALFVLAVLVAFAAGTAVGHGWARAKHERHIADVIGLIDRAAKAPTPAEMRRRWMRDAS
jgi:hypothetical protein